MAHLVSDVRIGRGFLRWPGCCMVMRVAGRVSVLRRNGVLVRRADVPRDDFAAAMEAALAHSIAKLGYCCDGVIICHGRRRGGEMG